MITVGFCAKGVRGGGGKKLPAHPRPATRRVFKAMDDAYRVPEAASERNYVLLRKEESGGSAERVVPG